MDTRYFAFEQEDICNVGHSDCDIVLADLFRLAQDIAFP
jgi:hypothetical protein